MLGRATGLTQPTQRTIDRPMTPPDRAEKRRLQRDLAKRGEALLKSGLPKHAARADIDAVTFQLYDALSDPAAAAGRAQQAFEAAARHAAPVTKLACKKGCGYCCYGIVMVSAPEAFRIAAWLTDQGPARVVQFRSAATLPAGKSPSDRHGAKIPCPLLRDGVCSAYHVRPISCRSITSFDLAPCLSEYEGQSGTIAVPDHYTAHAANAQLALAAALAAADRPVAYYEFSAAILRVLDTPNAAQRWTAGEDVFAGVLQDHDGVQNIAKAARTIASGLPV
jgi:hypothetical protein